MTKFVMHSFADGVREGYLPKQTVVVDYSGVAEEEPILRSLCAVCPDRSCKNALSILRMPFARTRRS